MKKSKALLILTAVIMLLMTVALFGCGKEKFTVTFDLDGGYLVSGSAVQSVSSASEIKAPTIEKGGYEFNGWDIVLDEITSSTTVKPRWTVKEYQIIYQLNDGRMPETNPARYTINDTFTLNNPVRDGFKFVGWTGSELSEKTMRVTLPKGRYGIRTYVANWEAVKYDVTYDLNGGTITKSNPVEYTVLDSITINNPTREGYDFAGWTGTGLTEPTNPLKLIKQTGDKHFEANWTAKEFKIYFEDPDGSPISDLNPHKVYFGDSVGELGKLPYAIKDGSIFEGWYYNGQKITEDTKYNFTTDITVTANYVDKYTIKFQLQSYFSGALFDFVYDGQSTKDDVVVDQLDTLDWLKDAQVHERHSAVFIFDKWVYVDYDGNEVEFTNDMVLTPERFPVSVITLMPKATIDPNWGPSIEG